MEPSRVLLKWSETPIGTKIHTQIRHTLNRLMSKHRGSYLLNVGIPDTAELLPEVKIPFKWSLSSNTKDPIYYDLLSELDTLPFPDNQFDVIIVGYLGLYNYSTDDLFKELYRILNDNGLLFLVDVSPWSPLAWQFGNYIIKSGGKYSFNSLHSVCRKLKLENFQIDDFEHLSYMPPIQNERILKYTQFFEALGPLLLFIPAGFYWVCARKVNFNVMPLTSYWIPNLEGTEKLELIS